MPTAHITLYRPGALEIRSLADSTWTAIGEEGLLGVAGTPKTLIELQLEHPSATILQPGALETEFPRVMASVAAGADQVIVKIGTFTDPPQIDADAWDIIEQGGAEFGFQPPQLSAADPSVTAQLTADPDVSAVVDAIADGWHMIRACCRGRRRDSTLTEVRIDIWPIDEPADREVLKNQPATLPSAATPADEEHPALQITDVWTHLQTALRETGVTNSTAYTLQATNTQDVQAIIDGHIHETPSEHIASPPAGLIDWFAIIHPLPDHRWYGLIPGYDVLDIDDAYRVRKQLLTAWDIGEAAAYPNIAGEPAYTFIPDYLPIAERDGNLLVVDLRPGSRSGLIRLFDKVDADDDTPTWPELATLLNELATAIANHQPFDNWLPTIDNGHLNWRFQH